MGRTSSKYIIVMAGFLFLAIASDVAYSYTEVSGEINSNTTWGPTGSPADDTYYVTGNITVVATLTIQAGTVVKFAPYVEMLVNGTLDVNGTPGSNVIFTSRDDNTYEDIISGSDGSPSAGDWDKIRVVAGAGYFDWCRIRYGGKTDANVVFLSATSDSYFDGSISEHSGNYGVRVTNCSPTFQGSQIQDNDSHGIYIDGTDATTSPEFRGCTIGSETAGEGNGGHGVYITGSNANPDFGITGDIGNNTFDNNVDYDLYNTTTNTIAAVGNTWDAGTYGPTMVVLSSFTAMTEDGRVILVWRTESEVGNVGFAIYRSGTKDGNYTRIAFVPGAQDSEISNSYQFIDKQVQPGHTYYYYLEDVDLSGKCTKSDEIRVILPTSPSAPERNCLLANYPNPSNPETWIPYNLAESADVTIRIYDVRGHLIRTLHLGHQPAGFYLGKDEAAYWDGRDETGDQVGSGIYFYSLSTGSFSAMRKMTILR